MIAKGAEVIYHDPHVPECKVDGKLLQSQPLSEELLHSATLVLIAVAHAGVDYAWVIKHAQRVFDTKNITGALAVNGKVRKL